MSSPPGFPTEIIAVGEKYIIRGHVEGGGEVAACQGLFSALSVLLLFCDGPSGHSHLVCMMRVFLFAGVESGRP